MPGRLVMGLSLLLVASGAAFGQPGVNSVNGYSPALRAKAEAAARAAGYTPTKIADVQAGYVLMWATKPGSEDAILTITPEGVVHAGGVAHPTPTGPKPLLAPGVPEVPGTP